MKLYTTKNVGGIVKDVDVKNRTVTGYFASFDTLDSDGDVFQKGAFKKTIEEGKSRIMHLLQHNPLMPIARPEVKEDSNGLYFVSKFDENQMNVKYIEDTLNLYASGVYNEHSVGFQTVKEHNEKDFNLITEVKLWEGSTVTWGANSNTPVTGLKSIFKDRDELVNRIKNVNNAIYSGNFSDETFKNLELFYEQLKSWLSVEPVQSTQPDKIENPLNDFTKSLSDKWLLN